VSCCVCCGRPTVEAVTIKVAFEVGLRTSRSGMVACVSRAGMRKYGGRLLRTPGGVVSSFTQVPDAGAGASSVSVRSTFQLPTSRTS